MCKGAGKGKDGKGGKANLVVARPTLVARMVANLVVANMVAKMVEANMVAKVLGVANPMMVARVVGTHRLVLKEVVLRAPTVVVQQLATHAVAQGTSLLLVPNVGLLQAMLVLFRRMDNLLPALWQVLCQLLQQHFSRK